MLEAIWARGIVTNHGPVQAKFESELSNVLGGRDVVATSSGTSALYIVLASLERRGDVIVSAFTHAATIQSVLRAGHNPVAVDVDKDDLNMSVVAARAAIQPSTVAILATHVFGHIADVEALVQLAREHGLPLFFDAAAAVGVTHHGTPIGAFGNASAFSFHATKVMSTIEGGAAVFNSSIQAGEARAIANFGLGGETANISGTNAKANELTSAIGLLSLTQLGLEITRRRAVRERYRRNLKEFESIRLVTGRDEVGYNGGALAVVIDSPHPHVADFVHSMMKANGIETRRYFAGPYSVEANGSFATADRLKTGILCLPIWGQMPETAIDKVCDVLVDAIESLSPK
jgi:dTDP-4-amino-4,6-dideoxygalactose transaminase